VLNKAWATMVAAAIAGLPLAINPATSVGSALLDAFTGTGWELNSSLCRLALKTEVVNGSGE
jgi:hypothetical protein